MQAHSYKCPCCASPLSWDGQSGEMRCDACGNTFPVDTLTQLEACEEVRDTTDAEMRWDMAGVNATEEEKAHLRAFTCPSCGGRMVVEDTNAANACPYCGNPAVMPEVLSGAFRPDGIIPFKKTRKEAQQAFRDLCKGKKLLPRGFAAEAQVEKIQGVYVPFWMFDCDTDSDVIYRATRVHTSREGQYEVTRTEHYQVRRGGQVDFKQVPVNSSSKLDDTLMEAVEPFQADQATAFTPAYLSGSLAERYDLAEERCQKRANARIRESVQRICAASAAGYTTLIPVSTSVRMKHAKARNVMMPVWLLNTRYHGKEYTFAMNGQTGRLVGNLPVDKGRALGWIAGLMAGLTGAGYLICLLLSYMGGM